MKSFLITILAYVTMALLFSTAMSQVVAPFGGGDDSAGGLDPDTNADPFRQIFAQGFVGGQLPVNSITKVPLILG